MLTTVPYSDAAGIRNVEWDAVSKLEYISVMLIPQLRGFLRMKF